MIILSISEHERLLKGLRATWKSLSEEQDHLFGALAHEHEAHPEEAVVAACVEAIRKASSALVSAQDAIGAGIMALRAQHGSAAADEMVKLLDGYSPEPVAADLSSEWTKTKDAQAVERGRKIFAELDGK